MARGARQLVVGELYPTAPKPELESVLGEPVRRGLPPKRQKQEDGQRLEQGYRKSPVRVHWREPVVATVALVFFRDRSPVPFGSLVCDRCAAEGTPAQLERFNVLLQERYACAADRVPHDNDTAASAGLRESGGAGGAPRSCGTQSAGQHADSLCNCRSRRTLGCSQ